MRVTCIPLYTAKWPMPIGHWRQWPMGIGHCCCINRIHRTRVGSRSSRAYTATRRYTVYSYTSLYTIHPLQHPSGKKTGEGFPLCCVGARARVCATSECPRPSVRSSELLVTVAHGGDWRVGRGKVACYHPRGADSRGRGWKRLEFHM